MPTILLRIFLLYNVVNSFLISLVPKKLRTFFPHSWFSHQTLKTNLNTTTLSSSKKGFVVITKSITMDPNELKRVFQMFDRNDDGRITKKELNDSLENLGIFIPDKELSQMIEKIDVNRDGCVDIEEFRELYESIMNGREEEEEEDMREAFNVFDQNGDGFISVEELRSVLVTLGLKQGRTVEDCKKMIGKVDVDGDGLVDYKEFVQMMKGGGFTALS
ncbi:calmodulin-like protein 3 [Cicer arietinum]|uniref:Calmodulin-like protein 7 n=1 Tax=Cicer arietinum TaxID=3827 RepID=A0A1S3E3K1_CICAR|nr:calmodulin-like protein 7 [Cicer arietinum]